MILEDYTSKNGRYLEQAGAKKTNKPDFLREWGIASKLISFCPDFILSSVALSALDEVRSKHTGAC